MAHAEQAHRVATVGVEAQRAVRQRARVGGEEGAAVRSATLHLAVFRPHVCALVADRAHQLAAIVLEDGRPEIGADAEPEAAQLLLGIARGRQPAQQDHAAAVLELLADVGEQSLRARQRKIFARDRVPFWTLLLARTAGEAVNLVSALASVGGEAVKAWLLRDEVSYEESVPSVIVAKTAAVVAQAILLVCGLAIAWSVFTRPWKISLPLHRHKDMNRVLEYQCQAEAEEAKGLFHREPRTWYPKP